MSDYKLSKKSLVESCLRDTLFTCNSRPFWWCIWPTWLISILNDCSLSPWPIVSSSFSRVSFYFWLRTRRHEPLNLLLLRRPAEFQSNDCLQILFLSFVYCVRPTSLPILNFFCYRHMVASVMEQNIGDLFVRPSWTNDRSNLLAITCSHVSLAYSKAYFTLEFNIRIFVLTDLLFAS